MVSRRLVRQMRVFVVALSVFLDYKMTQKKEKWTKESSHQKMWDRTHERCAKTVLRTITKLEGLWVKLGQYMSTRADVLPEAYIKCLRQLQDSLPPRTLAEIYGTIERELGRPPDELFRQFDDTPLATASIAQVHRAQTREGRDVVVKVQHQGIKEVILQDLKNAQTIVKWIAWAEPRFDFGPVMDEWCKEVPKELDFDNEAENTRMVARNLDLESGSNAYLTVNKVDVLIPEVIQSTERVLVLQYMDGVRLSDVPALDSLGVDKQALVESITRSYAHQIFIDGVFNADPHPGNFLVSKRRPFQPVLLDFGLTKSLSLSKKQALAKLLLACAEGDYSALLSAFAELGLKLRLDIPEEAMEVTNFFFRRSIPAKESLEDMKRWGKEVEGRRKKLEEKMEQEDTGKSGIRNPVDAFPGDAVFFMRVLNLLRGISSMLDTQVVYLEVMRPFAEATLFSGNVLAGGTTQINDWIHNNPAHSQAEKKLQGLLFGMAQAKRILGVQVCAYKNGEVIIDTAAGVLGKYDPRPVQADSLFSVFSVTKGVTSAILHSLVDQGKVKLEEKVATYWPEFGINGKENTTVAQVLNHTAGLQNALTTALKEDPFLMCKWAEILKRLAQAAPETVPGETQAYHTFTFGWLCGGIAEKASGKNFQELLDDILVNPLGVNGEFYIGIPPGVESRLATLSLDIDELKAVALGRLPRFSNQGDQNSEHNPIRTFLNGAKIEDIASTIMSLPALFNTLFVRRAIVPAANGHFSARALARFYATLCQSGVVPTASTSGDPVLGSHQQYPMKLKPAPKPNRPHEENRNLGRKVPLENGTPKKTQLFTNPKIIDEFLGAGDYCRLTKPGSQFGLGVMRMNPVESDENIPGCAFGHSGIGGSTSFCDPAHRFSIAVTLNKMNTGDVAAEIVRLVTSELGIPCPRQFSTAGNVGIDMRMDMGRFSV